MAVRRLAPEEIQPKSFAFSPENEVFAQEQIAKYPAGRQASAVIPLLWRAQEQAGGWLPRKAIETVAARLDMPDIRVMEVATFYTMFNLDPVGKYFIQFCGTTPCALRGAGDIKKVLERRVGEQNHVSADGNFSWLEVECLGACCNAPMVQINYDYYEDLTAENFEKLLDDLAAGRPVKPGPQSGRHTSEPQGDVKTLTDPALYDGSMVGAWRKRFEEKRRPNWRGCGCDATASQGEADCGRATETSVEPRQARQGRRADRRPPRSPMRRRRRSRRSRDTPAPRASSPMWDAEKPARRAGRARPTPKRNAASTPTRRDGATASRRDSTRNKSS